MKRRRRKKVQRRFSYNKNDIKGVGKGGFEIEE